MYAVFDVIKMEFTPLERAVLGWMASNVAIANLSEQIVACWPTERNLTGVGSYTRLAVSTEIPRIELARTRNPIVGPLITDANGIEGGGLSFLFLDNLGRVETLELVANGDHFDESVTEFVLRSSIEPGSKEGLSP